MKIRSEPFDRQVVSDIRRGQPGKLVAGHGDCFPYAQRKSPRTAGQNQRK